MRSFPPNASLERLGLQARQTISNETSISVGITTSMQPISQPLRCILSCRFLPGKTVRPFGNSQLLRPASMTRGHLKRHRSAHFPKSKSKKSKTQTEEDRFEGTAEQVLHAEVKSFLARYRSKSTEADREDPTSGVAIQTLPDRWSEIDVRISEISSTGDGLGFSGDLNHAFIVPFTAPGDLVRAKVARVHRDLGFSEADFVSITEPSSQRDDGLVKCQYFRKCSGCQFQMLSYKDQLAHKKTVIEKAFRNFSGLAPDAIPIVGDVVGSPLQYGYRTKLTPHFNTPRKRKAPLVSAEDHAEGTQTTKESRTKGTELEVPPIGYQTKGSGYVLDVEDCPIGTNAVREGMRKERLRVAKELHTYPRGATLLLRESTQRLPFDVLGRKKTSDSPSGDEPAQSKPEYYEVKTCVTDSVQRVREYVDDHVFVQQAGVFFQNNNSILPLFTQFVREKVVGPGLSSPLTQLIDAYCGSGLFTVTLASIFTSSTGIDIQPYVVAGARHNAEMNGVKNATFITATASAIFDELPPTSDAARTAVIIDPPRKGCDAGFLRQLRRFGPRRIIYVSCNCHTQARDVGELVEGAGEGARYEIECLGGFDFFPQTSHVESVAVLHRVGLGEHRVYEEHSIDSEEQGAEGKS